MENVKTASLGAMSWIYKMTDKAIISLHGQPLSRKDFMSAIDVEIVHLHETGDINRTMNVLNGLDAVEGITGHAKAKLLFGSSE